MRRFAAIDHGVKVTKGAALMSAALLFWGLMLTAYAAVTQHWIVVVLGVALLIGTAMHCRYWVGKLGRSEHNEWARHMNATWSG